MNKIEQSVRERFVSFTRGIKECLIVVTSSIAIATMLTACTPMKLEGKTPTKTPTPTRTPTGIVIKATPTPMPTFTAIGGGKTEITTTVEITSNLTTLLDPYNFYPDKNQSELMGIIEMNASRRINILVDAGLVFTNSITSQPITFSGVVKWRQAESAIPKGYQLVLRDNLDNSMHINPITGDIIYSMNDSYKDLSYLEEKDKDKDKTYHDILYGLQSLEIRDYLKKHPDLLGEYGRLGREQDRIIGASNCKEGAVPGKADCVREVIREK